MNANDWIVEQRKIEGDSEQSDNTFSMSRTGNMIIGLVLRRLSRVSSILVKVEIGENVIKREEFRSVSVFPPKHACSRQDPHHKDADEHYLSRT